VTAVLMAATACGLDLLSSPRWSGLRGKVVVVRLSVYKQPLCRGSTPADQCYAPPYPYSSSGGIHGPSGPWHHDGELSLHIRALSASLFLMVSEPNHQDLFFSKTLSAVIGVVVWSD